MNPPLVEATSIEKDFDGIRAVHQLTFNVQPGEIFALLGPNGAGKTTVVRMLLRILHPDRGSIRYCINGTVGEKVQPEQIGYLPEDRVLLMHRGRSVLEGTLAQVRAAAAVFKKVVLKVEGAVDLSRFERPDAVAHVEELAEGEYAFSLPKGASLSSFLGAVSTHLKISDIRSEDPSLHEIFLHTIGQEQLPDPEEKSA